MTIERDDIFWIVSCGKCSEQEEHDWHAGWQAMIDDLKNDGWRIRIRDGEWEHICPACVEEERDDG